MSKISNEPSDSRSAVTPHTTWEREMVNYRNPPVTPWKWLVAEAPFRVLRQESWLGWSRNKASVAEAVDGSPPF